MSKITRVPVLPGPKGIPGFVKWARAAYPQVYREVGYRLAQSGSLGALGISAPDAVAVAATKPSLATTILDTFKDLVTVGLPLYQQNKLFDLQVKRAQAGLPMLDTNALQDASGVRIGVDSATRNTGMLIAGAAVLGLLGFALLRRR